MGKVLGLDIHSPFYKEYNKYKVIDMDNKSKLEIATFAAGCFWCVEAIFQNIRGVIKVESGYAGGTVENPTYDQVSNGDTGHAESLQVTFDPSVITYKDLLFIFFRTHDPTTMNQQGADVGTQYRSAIFYHDKEQQIAAGEAMTQAQEVYGRPIVTQITPFSKFYMAEDYHKNYYENHKDAPYCKLVIDPKMAKLRLDFAKFLK